MESLVEIENAINNVEYETFLENHVLRIAIVKWIEIIGEASVYLSEGLKTDYPEIDWRAIKGMRNVVVHEYFGIKFDLIWEVASEQLPILKNQISKIIEEKF